MKTFTKEKIKGFYYSLPTYLRGFYYIFAAAALACLIKGMYMESVICISILPIFLSFHYEIYATVRQTKELFRQSRNSSRFLSEIYHNGTGFFDVNNNQKTKYFQYMEVSKEQYESFAKTCGEERVSMEGRCDNLLGKEGNHVA